MGINGVGTRDEKESEKWKGVNGSIKYRGKEWMRLGNSGYNMHGQRLRSGCGVEAVDMIEWKGVERDNFNKSCNMECRGD